jgi:hypothetical protein
MSAFGVAICPHTTTFVIQRFPVLCHHHVAAALRGLGVSPCQSPTLPPAANGKTHFE